MFWFNLYQWVGSVAFTLNIPDWIAVPVLDWLAERVPDDDEAGQGLIIFVLFIAFACLLFTLIAASRGML